MNKLDLLVLLVLMRLVFWLVCRVSLVVFRRCCGLCCSVRLRSWIMVVEFISFVFVECEVV